MVKVICKNNILKLLFLFVVTNESCFSPECSCEKLVGQNSLEIRKCFSKAIYDKTFYVNSTTTLYEYQNGLLLRKIENLSNGDSLLIREMRIKVGKSNCYLWLEKKKGEWIVFDAVSFSDGTVF